MPTKKRPKTTTAKTQRYEDLPDLVKPEEAPKFLRVSRNGIYELIHANALRSIKFGRLIRIPKQALLEGNR